MIRASMVSLGALVLCALAAAQTLRTYRAQHRPAAELLAVAESALGDQGRVSLDARTATLVFNGDADAIERVVALIAGLDRPMHRLVLTSEVRESRDLDALGATIRWQATLGPFRVGTLPLPSDGLRVALAANRGNERVTSRSVLRLLEGGSGTILTGRAFPVFFAPYWGTTAFASVDTGFEAAAAVLGDGRVQLSLRPFAGKDAGSGGLRYVEAATELVLAPGETAVVGEISRDQTAGATGTAGIGRSRESERQVLLVTVETEK